MEGKDNIWKFFILFFLCLSPFLVFIPLAQAQNEKGGLFTQGLTDQCLAVGLCTKCDIFMVIQNVFRFLLQIAGSSAIVALIISGIMYMLSGGFPGSESRPGALKTAKNAMLYAIIGLLIVFFAWSIVNTILHVAGYVQSGTWWKPSCQ